MRSIGWPEIVVNSSAPKRSGSFLREPATVFSSHLRRSASTCCCSRVSLPEWSLRPAPFRYCARLLPAGFDIVSTIVNHSFVTGDYCVLPTTYCVFRERSTFMQENTNMELLYTHLGEDGPGLSTLERYTCSGLLNLIRVLDMRHNLGASSP